MPIHDWTRVDAGIYHDFHCSFVVQLSRQLNSGLLPTDHYSLIEGQVAEHGVEPQPTPGGNPHRDSAGLMVAEPLIEESFYIARRRTVAVRHITDDRAVVSVCSPSKSGYAI